MKGSTKAKERGGGRWKKRYTVLSVFLALTAGYLILHHFTQLPVYLYSSAMVSQQFRAEGQSLQFRNGKEWEDFQVRGIVFEVPSCLDAGYSFYWEWLEKIGETNANTIRTMKLMEPEFYRALADYNQGRKTPLYLLQGIQVDPELLENYADAHEADLEDRLKAEAKNAVDAIHGNLPLAGYRTSVSDTVLGFIVGQSWDPDFIIYTNRIGKGAGEFQGRYIRTSQYSTSFENILAKTIDTIFAYDTGKYRSQHMVAFGNEHDTDNLVHQKAKVNSLNENRVGLDENILYPRDSVKTGVFAAYEVNMGVTEEFNYEPYYKDYITEEGYSSPFQRYLLDLKASHQTMPIIISGFGLSTARGSSGKDEVNGYDRGGLTEEKQADGLLRLYQDILEAGLSGGCIAELFDNPDRTAWNTKDYVDEDGTGSWLNVQDSEQGLGLVRLTSSREESIVLDGEFSDWEGIEPYLDEGGNRFYFAYDEKYVYLAGRIQEYYPVLDRIYVAFDTNPQSGSTVSTEHNLHFDRDMDFVLYVSEDQWVRLWVQEYYDPFKVMERTEPDLAENAAEQWRVPAKDSGYFQEIRQFVQRKTYLQNDPDLSVEELAQRLQETGSMYEDTGNIVEESGVFSVQGGDFARTEEGYELRIPWQLLNFSDPSNMKITADFHEPQKGSLKVKEIYLQTFVSRGEPFETSGSRSVPVKGWEDEPAFGFETKASFEALGQVWGGAQ